MNKYVELPKEHITFYGDTEEEKKKNETIFDLSLEVDRLNNIIEQVIEYIEYSLKNKDSDERMILQMVLAKLKVELEEGK